MKLPISNVFSGTPAILDSFLNSDPSLSAIGVLTGVTGVAYALYLRDQDPSSGATWILLIAGLFLIGLSLVFRGGQKKLSAIFHRPMAWLGIGSIQVMILLLAPILAVMASQFAGYGPLMRQPIMAIVSWLAAILCAILGGWGKSRPCPKVNVKDILILLGLILLALLLRGYDTTHLPLVLNGDEASAGLSSINILNGNENNIFGTSWYSFPRLFFVLQALSIHLFGQTTPALRLLSALAGALTVGALYLLACSLFSRWTALACGFFLAVFHFHIHFSRIGLNNIWDGLFFTLTLGLLWGAWKHHSRLLYILSGACLGLSQYFYTSSRLLVFLVALTYLGLGIIGAPSSGSAKAKNLLQRMRALLPDLIILYWTAAVIFLPLGLFFIHAPYEFVAPMNRVRLDPEWFRITSANLKTSYAGVMLNQILLSLRSYIELPIRVWYDSRTPILLTIPAIFFCLGIILLLARKYRAQAWLIFTWLGSISLIGALSKDTPAAQRYIAAAPALSLLVGCGVTGVLALLIGFWPGRRVVWAFVGILLMTWIGWNELDHYFIDYAPRSFVDNNTQTAQILANYLRNIPAGTELCFISTTNMSYNSISSLQYLAPQINGHDCPVPFDTRNNPRAARKYTVFAILPENINELAAVRASYPGGILKQLSGAYRGPDLWIYDLTP